MKSKTRNLYIDVMKGLLIILVVIGHLPFFEYDSRTLTLIYSFHMHAFLIIGGILSHVDENTKLSTIIVKKFKNILIPYFIFYAITLVFIPTATMDQKIKAIFVVFKGIGDPVNALNLPLWFLTFYFVAMLTFEFIEWLSYRIKTLVFGINQYGENEKYWFVALITLIFVSIIMFFSFRYARYYKMPRLPFNIEIAGFCLGFVFFGKILGKYVPIAFNEFKNYTSYKIIGSILIFIILAIFIYAWYFTSMYNGRIDLNARDYKNAFLMYIDAILAFFIFSVFSYIISMLPIIKNDLAIIGENSIYILAYHVPSVFVLNCFVLPYLPPIIGLTLQKNSIISITILTSFAILFSLILALIHKSISGLLKKARENN